MAATPHATANSSESVTRGGKDEDGNGTLGDIEQRDRDRILPPQHPVEIRRTEVAAAVFSQIDFGE